MKTFNKVIPKEDYMALGSNTLETGPKRSRWGLWAITQEDISQYSCCYLAFQVVLDNNYNENSNMKIKFKEKKMIDLDHIRVIKLLLKSNSCNNDNNSASFSFLTF